jgi:hypothetical protein
MLRRAAIHFVGLPCRTSAKILKPRVQSNARIAVQFGSSGWISSGELGGNFPAPSSPSQVSKGMEREAAYIKRKREPKRITKSIHLG